METHDHQVVFAAWIFTSPRWSHIPPLGRAIYPTLRTWCDSGGVTLLNYAGLSDQAGMTPEVFRAGLNAIACTEFDCGTLARPTHIVLDDKWISKIRVKLFCPTRPLVLWASLFRRESGTPWPALSLAARAVFPVVAAQASERGPGRGLPDAADVARLAGLSDADAAQEAVEELKRVGLMGVQPGGGWVAISWPAGRVRVF